MNQPEIGDVIEYRPTKGPVLWRAEVVEATTGASTMKISYLMINTGVGVDLVGPVGAVSDCSIEPWWSAGQLRRVDPLTQLAHTAPGGVDE